VILASLLASTRGGDRRTSPLSFMPYRTLICPISEYWTKPLAALYPAINPSRPLSNAPSAAPRPCARVRRKPAASSLCPERHVAGERGGQTRPFRQATRGGRPAGVSGHHRVRCDADLTDDDTLQLPILAPPSFLGSFVTSRTTASHTSLCSASSCGCGRGRRHLPACGRTVRVFPGGMSRNRGRDAGASRGIAKHIPTPGGGMSLERIPDCGSSTANEVIFLVGGDLLRNSAEIEKSCARYRRDGDVYRLILREPSAANSSSKRAGPRSAAERE